MRGDSPVTGRLVHTGPMGTGVVDLGRYQMVLGRGPDGVDHVLGGKRVSRRHCRVEPDGAGGHLLVDLCSRSGTFLNERRVSSALLEPFDRIRVGENLLVYLDPTASAEKVRELMTPGETRHPGALLRRGSLAEHLLEVTLLVQDRGSELDLAFALQEVLDDLLSFTGHDRGAFLLQEPDARADAPLRLLCARGMAESPIEPLAGAVGAALEAGRSLVTATPLGPETLCVPLGRRSAAHPDRRPRCGAVRGALLLAGRPRPWTPSPEEDSLLRALGQQVAVVVMNARLERQVTTDPLTGLASRACLERLLAEVLLEVSATGEPAGVVLLDVDDFKRVNDTHGHATGDAVLRQLAAAVRGSLRQTDWAGRWGGEEFLLVLPGADLGGATTVAERLLRLVRTGPLGGTGVRTTVSAGVASAPLHGTDPRMLLQGVDQALYRAKRTGKDRCCAWAASAASEPDPDSGEQPALSPGDGAALAAGTPPVAWLDCDLLPPVPLQAGSTSLGRSTLCDVVLAHRDVSRRHGVLHLSEDGRRVRFEDTSRNGSTLNGEAVSGTVELSPGDTLRVGPYALRVRRSGPPEPLDTTPGQSMVGGRLEDGPL